MYLDLYVYLYMYIVTRREIWQHVATRAHLKLTITKCKESAALLSNILIDHSNTNNYVMYIYIYIYIYIHTHI